MQIFKFMQKAGGTLHEILPFSVKVLWQRHLLKLKRKKVEFSMIFLKVDQCQPHVHQSSQVVNCVKTKPRLAGNQIPFGGTRFGFV